ncbi:hypothetical protein JYU34_005436 [Plutella xylostella]|uniref:Secreted protein n=1 Tax=Plutella xylostella TaxID=51655 RepID=A0ABQ7QWP4_PLUXY|nr:hypothetical protein JYU34_005436 [Plutella xylostella]
MCYATMLWMRLISTNHIIGAHSLALVETDSTKICFLYGMMRAMDVCYGCVLWICAMDHREWCSYVCAEQTYSMPAFFTESRHAIVEAKSYFVSRNVRRRTPLTAPPPPSFPYYRYIA